MCISENVDLPESSNEMCSRIRIVLWFEVHTCNYPPGTCVNCNCPALSIKNGREKWNYLLNDVWMKHNFPVLHIQFYTNFFDLCKTFHLTFFLTKWHFFPRCTLAVMYEIQLFVGKTETSIVLKKLWTVFLLKSFRSIIAFLDQM